MSRGQVFLQRLARGIKEGFVIWTGSFSDKAAEFITFPELARPIERQRLRNEGAKSFFVYACNCNHDRTPFGLPVKFDNTQIEWLDCDDDKVLRQELRILDPDRKWVDKYSTSKQKPEAKVDADDKRSSV